MVMFRQDLHIYPAWDEKTVRAEADNFQTVHADSISSHASQELLHELSKRDILPIKTYILAFFFKVFFLSDSYYLGLSKEFWVSWEQIDNLSKSRLDHTECNSIMCIL